MTTTNQYLYLKAVRGDETVTLHVVGSHLKFLGASVEASVEPGYDELAPITFIPPEKGTTGLIAFGAYLAQRITDGGHFLESMVPDVILNDSLEHLESLQHRTLVF